MRPLPRKIRASLRAAVSYFRHRGLREEDVFLASYPRSGNTWIKFMLAELMINKGVNFNSVETVIPYVGAHQDAVQLWHGGRIIKTHEKFRREYKRSIYIVRDGRDVAVSYYHMWLRHNQGDFSAFLKRFLDGEIDYYGTWPDNVESWLKARKSAQVLVVKYEECLHDPQVTLLRILEYAGVSVDEMRLQECILSNKPERMKAKELLPKHQNVRKGVAGDWMNYFSPSDLELFMNRAGATLVKLGYPGMEMKDSSAELKIL